MISNNVTSNNVLAVYYNTFVIEIDLEFPVTDLIFCQILIQ